MWLGAIALDALFGGRKALGAIPSLDTLSQALFTALQSRLERKARGSAALFWRGTLVLIVLGGLLSAAGNILNSIVFYNAGIAALSTAILARYLKLKILFQSVRERASEPSGTTRRHAIEESLHYFAAYYVPALVLFAIGGFSLLAPYYLLYWVATQNGADAGSRYIKSFLIARNMVAFPGEMLASLFLLLGASLWPNTHLLQGVKGLMVCGTNIKQWSPSIMAHAFGISLRSRWPGVPKWLGSDLGTADVSSTAGRNALIVALIAFAASLAFLLVIVAASLLG